MKVKFYGNHGWITPTDNHSCFLLEIEDKRYLFDAGAPGIVEPSNFNLDAIFLTHIHLDHIKNLYNLLGYMNLHERTKYLPIFTPSTLEGKISDEIIPIVPQPFKREYLTEIPHKFTSVDFEVLELKQGKDDVFAYKVRWGTKSLVFATDTRLTDELKEFCKGADLLICDACVNDDQPQYWHMGPKDVQELIDYANPKTTVLTHFELVEPEEFHSIVGRANVLIAEEGLELRLKKYGDVAFAGTFGPLHEGHKSLIKRAVELGDRIHMGVTSDEMIAHKDPKPPTYEERVKAIEEYIDSLGDFVEVDIQMITDLFGPLLDKDMKIDALLLSEEGDVNKNAGIINQKRSELGMKEIEFEVMPLLTADDGERISSTRIRKGEIDKDGKILD